MTNEKKLSAKNAGDAAEFYVAYMLSRLGISAALTTSGTSAVDIVATIDGSKSISIQVKGSWARSQPRQWMIGTHKPSVSPDLFYIFCNMPGEFKERISPEIFIVPSADVFETATWHHKAPLFKITPATEDSYKNNWDALLTALIHLGQ
ncbi:hypothetical protein [Brenneria uluponensis]|uniref:hypothetical protein n=1 Tax=Brenneria uluponensis TaxID=3057057 RepID=UPI0028E67C65|nr:hypothetical protein [Brenneria ulupoensis]